MTVRDPFAVASQLGCLECLSSGTVAYAEWLEEDRVLVMATAGGCEHVDGVTRVVDLRDLPHACCCETGCPRGDEPDHHLVCTIRQPGTQHGRRP